LIETIKQPMTEKRLAISEAHKEVFWLDRYPSISISLDSLSKELFTIVNYLAAW